VALLGLADRVEHDPLHRRHHVVVEEAVHHAHAERVARILGDQAHASGMEELEVLDDDARLHHGACLVDHTGMRCSGQSAACSAAVRGSSGVSRRISNGVAFSYSAISTFWQ
jgi:hypothetical protein